MRDTLIIVGSHDRTRDAFDWSRDDCDVWLMNEACAPDGWAAAHADRVDAIFQMHAEAIWRNPDNHTNPQNAAWLMSGNTPTIFMQGQFADVPRSEAYPLERVCTALLAGYFEQRYFTSSVAYALALGIYRGYGAIELYGVELENDTEYRYQRESYAFWTGLAVGRGIKVTANSKLFDQPLYGYEGDVAIPMDDFKARLDELKPQVQLATDNYIGYHRAFETIFEALVEGTGDRQIVSNGLRDLAIAANQYGQKDGARQETERFMKKAEDMAAKYGEYVIVRGEFERAAATNGLTYKAKQQELDAIAGALGVSFEKAVAEKSPSKRRKALQGEVMSLANQYITLSIWAGIYSGAYSEGTRYMVRVDELIKAAGGAKSERVLLEKMGVPVSAGQGVP